MSRSFDNLPGSLPNSKQEKHRNDITIPKIAYEQAYYDDNTDIRKMINGEPKEKCARCKALGIFICEHKTPVRDKYRNMYTKQGKFYESPRDYEDELEPSIYTDVATYSSPQVNQSHNALSFQRFQAKQQQLKEDARLKSLDESSFSIKKPKKKVLKINSLKAGNTVSISRLSFKQQKKSNVNGYYTSTPRTRSNGNANYNNSPMNDKNTTNGRKPINNNNHNDLFSNEKNGEEVEDLEDDNPNNNNDNYYNSKPMSRQKSSNNMNKKKEDKGCCTIL